jgi:hypothetical protein
MQIKPDKVYSFTCAFCSTIFERNTKRTRKYCSQKCYIDNKIKIKNEWKKEQPCVICGNLFVINFKGHKCCSKKCTTVAYSTAQKTSVLVSCFRCKKDFERQPAIITTKNFCSWECRKEPKERICRNCKKQYFCKSSKVKISKFCSRSCAKSGKFHHGYGKPGPMTGKSSWAKGLTAKTDSRIASLGVKISKIQKLQFLNGTRTNAGSSNPNFGKTVADRTEEQLENYSKAAIGRVLKNQVGHGKNTKHGYYFSSKMNQFFYYRSSFELRFMKILDRNIHVKLFWHEPFSIKYGVGKRYLPDFKVEYFDENIEIIETKPKFQFDDEVVKAKEAAAISFCSKLGWKYVMISLDEIKQFERDFDIIS